MKLYGQRLESVILYGSFAKDVATEDSDTDIAIILKGKVNCLREIDRLCHFFSDIGLEYNELVSVLPVSSQEVKNSR